MNLSALRPKGRVLPSTRAQAEGLKVHPEPRFLTPPLKVVLHAAERVKSETFWNQVDAAARSIREEADPSIGNLT